MKKKLLSVLIALSVFVTPITVSAEELSTPSGITYSQIDNELDSYIETYEEGLASCEVAVFDKNGLITSNYYGYSDIENQVEADASTVYEWGSCSKLLVWTAVMQQCERGNIDLDTDIRAYLPEGFLTKLQYEDEKITMVQVLGHGGNTGGCSSMLKFDPESGLGLVIMTNEPGETMFNYGIPNLIFGKITDRAEFKCVELQDENDISGIYLSKRTIDTGAACFPDKWNYFRL